MGIIAFSDWFYIFYFRSEFKERLTVYLEVLYECHRAIENFLMLRKMTVGYYSLACIHEIVSLSII